MWNLQHISSLLDRDNWNLELTIWLQNLPFSGLMPITDVPVKISSGFQGSRKNFITMVHLVVISYAPVYSNSISPTEQILEYSEEDTMK